MENWLCEMQVAPDKDDFSDAPEPFLSTEFLCTQIH